MDNNNLIFDGCDVSRLAAEYGTPLYVYSENAILKKFAELKDDFLNKYPNTRVAYAAKAFFPLAMAQLLNREGMCVDVVSGGELYTAIAGGIAPERIEFNGNNKLPAELEMAVEHGIGRVIVDNAGELALLDQICAKKGKQISILFRVTPGVVSETHDYMITGQKDCKFGTPFDDTALMPMIKTAADSLHVDFRGLHFHIGSQIFANDSFLQALEIILELATRIKKELNLDLTELNLGGGFGVKYTDEKAEPFRYYLEPMMARIEEYYRNQNAPRPAVVIEPGRGLIAEAGITVYTVGSIKTIEGGNTYVAVDGGMTDNIRPALYGAKYTGVIANKASEPATEKVVICGKCCESGDILIYDIMIPRPSIGDKFVVFSTGAYGYSMANNYNKNPIPGVVLAKDGQSRLIVKPQSYQEMIERELAL